MRTKKTSPDVTTYKSLLAAIRGVRKAIGKRIERAIEREKVREAWETGRLIATHILKHKERADYGEQVLKRLFADLGASQTELRYMVEFFRTYPIHPAPGELSWAHYRELLSLNDEKLREDVTREAVRQRWNQRELREEVHRRKSIASSVDSEKLSVAALGALNTYWVVRPAEGPYAGQLALDLGFEVTVRPAGLNLAKFRLNDTVQFRAGKLARAGTPPSYTYQAYVIEVIDGDTFHARVDLGFGITIHQKLRLRGVDAAQVESADGLEAKVFLEDYLPLYGQPILIRTLKFDKYDRYLADVFIGDSHLNQQLLDRGLAVMVEE